MSTKESLVQKVWKNASLPSRRWLVEKRREAVEQNDHVLLKELLSYQCDCKVRELTSALGTLLRYHDDSCLKCVQLLVHKGADVNGVIVPYSKPFLILAVETNKVQVVKWLLENGCQADVRKKETGETALHRAAALGHPEICSVLLSSASHLIDAHDCSGKTALIHAVQRGFCEVVHLLIINEADLLAADLNQKTPLHWAVATRHVNILKCLLGENLDEGIVESKYETDRYGLADISKICDDADWYDYINCRDDEGYTPLMTAALSGFEAGVGMLLLNKAAVDLVDNSQNTALHIAALNRKWASVYKLIEAKANVALLDGIGRLTLEYVIDQSSLVEMALECGSPVSAADGILLDCICKGLYHSVFLLLVHNHKSTFNPVELLKQSCQSGKAALYRMLLTTFCALGYNSTVPAELFKTAEEFVSSHERDELLYFAKDLIHDRDCAHLLQRLCRRSIRGHLTDGNVLQKIDSLHLPPALINYIKLPELHDAYVLYGDLAC